MHEWRQQLHCGQGFKWTQMNWNIQHLVVNSHKKWAPAALLPQHFLPNRWIEKKNYCHDHHFILYTSPYLNLHYIIYICNCCLHSDNLHYPSNNHRSVKWTCYIIIYIIRLLVFGGFGSQRKHVETADIDTHPDPGLSILKANTLLQLGEGWLRHLLSHTFFWHTGPLQLVSTEVNCLGLWNVTTFD